MSKVFLTESLTTEVVQLAIDENCEKLTDPAGKVLSEDRVFVSLLEKCPNPLNPRLRDMSNLGDCFNTIPSSRLYTLESKFFNLSIHDKKPDWKAVPRGFEGVIELVLWVFSPDHTSIIGFMFTKVEWHSAQDDGEKDTVKIKINGPYAWNISGFQDFYEKRGDCLWGPLVASTPLGVKHFNEMMDRIYELMTSAAFSMNFIQFHKFASSENHLVTNGGFLNMRARFMETGVLVDEHHLKQDDKLFKKARFWVERDPTSLRDGYDMDMLRVKQVAETCSTSSSAKGEKVFVYGNSQYEIVISKVR